jgi:hypothetical protein
MEDLAFWLAETIIYSTQTEGSTDPLTMETVYTSGKQCTVV